MKDKKAISLGEIYIFGKDRMMESGIENPGLEASLLLSRALGIRVLDIYVHPEREVNPDGVEWFYRLLERRIKREPLAYILGEKEFYSRSFIVTPDVLIPRPETETLVEEALRTVEKIPLPSVIDVGTGSGCVSVTLGCECRDARITASDISLGALMVARENARRHGVSDRISLVCSDLLGCFKERSFDIVLSNPPYVASSDYPGLQPEVRDFEPKVSLLGGEDGLDFIRRIALEARGVLKEGGWCIIEIGAGQAKRAWEVFEESGFNDISITSDLLGIERVIKGKWTG
jgi:release factor glutamine methyltransferase